jgi:hypothetical protein
MRYSTGRPGRENAPAVAEPPATPTRPGTTAAAVTTAMAPIVSRRGMAFTASRIFPTKLILLFPICRKPQPIRALQNIRVARVVNHTIV